MKLQVTRCIRNHLAVSFFFILMFYSYLNSHVLYSYLTVVPHHHDLGFVFSLCSELSAVPGAKPGSTIKLSEHRQVMKLLSNSTLHGGNDLESHLLP